VGSGLGESLQGGLAYEWAGRSEDATERIEAVVRQDATAESFIPLILEQGVPPR